jgi:hypothetical protein
VSHWFFGDRSLRQNEPSLMYTLTGYVTHHAAAIFWGVLAAKAWGGRDAAKKPLPAIAGGVATAAVACFVDYKLTPKRLTPGFEHRLGRPEMANVYAFFALGIAIGTMVMSKRR